MDARTVIRRTSAKLISDWRATHAPPEAPADDRAATEKAADGNMELSAADIPAPPPAPAAAPGKPGPRQQGVAPGSFLGLMLDARDRETGQQLTDLQVKY